MDKLNIPEELQISVFHEGVVLLLAYSPFDQVIETIAGKKKSGELVHEITNYNEQELRKKYPITSLSVHNTSAWAKFLKQLRYVSRKYEEFHPIVLGSVIEIMDELNWQEQVDIRRLLTFFLNTEEELAHLRLAVAGEPLKSLLVWRETIIEEAKGYAAYKSKLA